MHARIVSRTFITIQLFSFDTILNYNLRCNFYINSSHCMNKWLHYIVIYLIGDYCYSPCSIVDRSMILSARIQNKVKCLVVILLLSFTREHLLHIIWSLTTIWTSDPHWIFRSRSALQANIIQRHTGVRNKECHHWDGLNTSQHNGKMLVSSSI